MKLSRKIIAAFGAAAALAMASTFVGCSDDDENEDGVITVTKNGASVNYDNSGATGTADADSDTDTNPSVRRFAIAKVGGTLSGDEHFDSICKIDYKAANGSPMGYIFGLQGDGSDDKPYSFGIVGLRVKDGVPQYYVSWLKGITGSKGSTNMIEKANFGVGNNNTSDENSFTDDKLEYEAAGYTNIGDADTILKNDTLSVVVDIRAVADGHYEVAFYKNESDAISDRTSDKNATSTGKNDAFATSGDRVYTKAIGTQKAASIPASVTAKTKDTSKVAQAIEAGLAYYVNVLPTTKVEGTWTVSDADFAVTAQDEVVVE